MSAVLRAWERLQRTRPLTAWKRFGERTGNLLAAGIGYTSFFAVFPAVALAFAVFGFVLRGNPHLLTTIADSLNETLPGMVRTPSNPSGVIGLSSPRASTLTVTGVVAFLLLVWTGMGWMGSMRAGIRTIFGLPGDPPGNIVKVKLRDLLSLVTMGSLIAISAVLTSLVGTLTDTIADWLGLSGASWLVTVAGLLVGLLFDALIMVVLLRMCADVPLPLKGILEGALVGGTLMTLVKLLGTKVIASSARNPLLATVAVAVGLLVILNLIAKIVLLSAAWASLDLEEAGMVEHLRTVATARATVWRDERDAIETGRAVPLGDGPEAAPGAVDGPAYGAAKAPSRQEQPPTGPGFAAGASVGAVVGAIAGALTARRGRPAARRSRGSTSQRERAR